MSTALYAHIEVKINGEWYAYACPTITGQPELFQILRSELPTSIDLKECPLIWCTIPKAASVVTRTCYEEDCKRFVPREIGTIEADAIAKAQNLMYKLNPSVERTGIDKFDFEHSIFHAYINGGAISEHKGFEDVRIIYWFNK